MKRTFLIVAVFIIANSVLLGLGWESLLNLMSLALSVAPDSRSGIALLPQFMMFCIAMGIIAFSLVVGILLANISLSDKLKYTKRVWSVQYILSFALSIPMIGIWEKVFCYLREII